MAGENPLVAAPPAESGAFFNAGTGDNGWATGISIAESAMDTFNGIKDGNWIEAGLGVVGLAADAAAMAIDPFGTLLSSAASFLMEHMQPLKDMLDWLAGNPPVIESYSTTWNNVATELGKIAEEYAAGVQRGTEGWTGSAAETYHANSKVHGDALAGAASAAGTVGTVVGLMGMVVAFVREMVRDLIADLVGKLIAWVLEAVFSLGFGTPVIVAQAVTAISKWAAKIAKVIQDLLNTIKKVSPMLKRLVEVFEKIMKVVGKLAGKVTGLDVLDPKNIKKGGFLQTGRADIDTPSGSPSGTGRDAGTGNPSTSDTPASRPGDTTTTSNTTTDPTTSRPGRGDPTDVPAPTSRPGRDPGTPDNDLPRGTTAPGSSAPGTTTPRGNSPIGEHRGGPGGQPGPGGTTPLGEHRGGPGGQPGSGGTTPLGEHRGGPGGQPAPSSATPLGEHRGGPGGQPGPGSTTPLGEHRDGPGGQPAPGGYSAGGGPSPSGGGPVGGSGGGGSQGGSPSGGGVPNSPAAPPPHRIDQTSAATAAAPEAPSRPDQPHTGSPNTGNNPNTGQGTPHSGPPHAGPTHSGPGNTGPANARPQGGPPHAGPTHTNPAPAGPPHQGPPHQGPPHQGPPRNGPANPSTPHGPSHTTPSQHGPNNGPPHRGPAGAPHQRDGSPDFTRPRGGDSPVPHTPNRPFDGPPPQRHPDAQTPAPRHAPDTQLPPRRDQDGIPAPRRDPNAWTPPHRDHDPNTHRPDADRPDSGTPDRDRHHTDPNADSPTPDGPDTTRPDGDQPSIDEAHARHGETTPAGVSHHRGDPDMGDLPHRVPPDPRYFTADVHITPDGRARIGNHTYTPEQYGDLLRRNGWDGKTPIRLIGCDAGANDFANRLSRHTGADVLAPTKPAWTDANGRVYTSDAEIGPDGNRQPKIPPNGEWNTHRPDGTTTRAGEDGYAPDTHDADKADHTSPDDARDRGADHNPESEVDRHERDPRFSEDGPDRLPDDLPSRPEEPRLLQQLDPDLCEVDGDGLITHYNGQDIKSYLDDVMVDRARVVQTMMHNGDLPPNNAPGKPKNWVQNNVMCTSVAVDRQTGRIYESINGPRTSVIPDDQLHDALRDRMENMRRNPAEGEGYPQFDRRTGEILNYTEFPINDNPLRHAEVKNVNQMLHDRGVPGDVSPEELAEHLRGMRVANVFPHWEPFPAKAKCCANCNNMIAGVPSSTGRNSSVPGDPDNVEIESE
ncbi:hypothetical protein AB0425_05550 [Actinosynnema sp. NPDC051121]